MLTTVGARPNAGRFGRVGLYSASLVCLAAALAGVAAVVVPPLAFLFALVGAIWCAWLFRFWPVAALLTVVISVAVPRYVYSAAGVSVTAERVAIPLVSAALVVTLVTISRPRGFPLGWSHAAFGAYVAANAVGAYLHAPSALDSLRLTVLIAVASLPFWILPGIVRDARSVRFAYGAFVAAGIFEALFGLAAVATYALLGANIGVQFDPLTQVWAPYGTQWEGNTFGSFVAAALVMTVAAFTSTTHSRRRRRVYGLAIAVLVSALAASLSRGAWIGAFAGVSVVLLWVNWSRIRLAAMLVGAGALLAASASLWLPADSEFWQFAPLTRLSLLGGLLRGDVDGTTLERFYTYGLAFEAWQEHPLIGWGAGSFGQRFTYLSQDIPGWIGNLELHALHDSGLIGLIGLGGAMLGVVLRLIQAIRHTPSQNASSRAMLVGLLGTCVTLLVAYQATEATWLGYTWYVFGLSWVAAGPAITSFRVRATGQPRVAAPVDAQAP